METILGEICTVLTLKARAVFKTSKNFYQRVLVPTPNFLMLSGERIGFKKSFAFTDRIHFHSMSTQSAPRDRVVKRD